MPCVTSRLVKDGPNLYWWVVEPKTPNQAFALAWWLMVHSFWSAAMLGLYEGNMDLLWKPFQQSNHRRHFTVKQNDHCREPTWAPQNSINMNSNKLKRLRKIWWVTGEGYSLKTRDMEWGWLDVSWSFCKECFGMVIDLFLLLVPWLGFWLLVEAKGCFWAREGCLDITAFPSFIVVGGVPWSSWFWPGHFFNFWIMGFLIGVKLTMFPR